MIESHTILESTKIPATITTRELARINCMTDDGRAGPAFWLDHAHSTRETLARAALKLENGAIIAWVDLFSQVVKMGKGVVNPDQVFEQRSKPQFSLPRGLVLVAPETFDTIGHILETGPTDYTAEWIESYYEKPPGRYHVGFPAQTSPTTVLLRELIELGAKEKLSIVAEQVLNASAT